MRHRRLLVIAVALLAGPASTAASVATLSEPSRADVAAVEVAAPAAGSIGRAVRRHPASPDGSLRVTSWSRNVVEIDPFYRYNCHACVGNASITVRGRADEHLVGRTVTLKANLGPNRRWVAIAEATVKGDHTFRLENAAIPYPIPGRLFSLRAQTDRTASTRATKTSRFRTRGWHTVSLDEFPTTSGGLQHASITEPDGPLTFTSTVFSPTTGSTSFDIAGDCRALWTKAALDPYSAQPTDLRSVGVLVDGVPTYSGVVGKGGTYIHSPGITFGVRGAATVTITDTAYPGATGGPAWFDTFVTCSS